MNTLLLIVRAINGCFTLFRNLKKHRSVLKPVGRYLTQGSVQLNQFLNRPYVVTTKGLSVVVTPSFVLRSFMALNILAMRALFFFLSLLTFAIVVSSGMPIHTALIVTGGMFLSGKIALDYFDKLNKD
jgi:hypothetical protein